MDPQLISPSQAERIRAKHAAFIGYPEVNDDVLERIRLATQSTLPRGILSLVTSMNFEGGPETIFIRGLVSESDLPDTPHRADSNSKACTSLLSAIVLLGFAKTLGEPPGYKAEKKGALVQSVFPIEAESNSSSNESSSSALDLHTELVFSRHNPTRPLDAESPDFILLLCLRSDPGGSAATIIAPVDDLCSGLSEACLRVLSEARFEQRAPYSFTRDEPSSRPWVGPVPILSMEGSKRHAAFDLACGTRGIDEEAEAALKALRKAATAPGVVKRLHLREGDLLILNNRRCAHGRTPFFARFDGADRWLLRAYVRRSLSGMVPVESASPRVF